MKKIYSIISFGLALSIGVLISEVPSYSQDGSEAFPTSKVLKDPAAMGMGGAGMASTSSMSWSAFGNPSKLAFADGNLDAQFSYLDWQVEASPSTSLSLGATYKFTKNLGFTIGASSTSWDAYDVYYESNPSVKAGTYTPKDMQFNLGFGYRFLPSMSVGANVRYLHSALSDDANCSAISADVMFMTDFSFTSIKGLSATLGVTDLGAVSSDDSQTYKLPSAVSFGAGYSTTFAESHGLEADMDVNYFLNSSSVSVALGAQYNFNKMFFARAGYHLGGKSVVPSFATAGLGVHIFGVKLDAAYVIGSDGLKNSMIFGLGYSF